MRRHVKWISVLVLIAVAAVSFGCNQQPAGTTGVSQIKWSLAHHPHALVVYAAAASRDTLQIMWLRLSIGIQCERLHLLPDSVCHR